MTQSDADARARALTDLQSTLLVEAAAGTGKTALIAGRVTVMLARGVHPANIAAITFTELAASELSARVHLYVSDLLAGTMPKALRLAFPNSLKDEERESLVRAFECLDELTATTIHSFCQRLITSYVVEADVDPGAQILDAEQSDAVFDSIVEGWLKRRLNAQSDGRDPVAVLSKSDPRKVVERLRRLAGFRLRHRRARAAPADLSGRPDAAFCEAVNSFSAWFRTQPPEPLTQTMCKDFETLEGFYRDSFTRPFDFQRMWQLAHPPPLSVMRKGSSELLRPSGKFKSAWERAVGKAKAPAAHATMVEHFAAVDLAYRALMGRLSTAIVASLSADLEEILTEYAQFKRNAARLDFDDLIEKARDVLARSESVRKAVGERYAHILVDEFQDTDSQQCEVLFGIASQVRASHWSESRLRAGALFMVGDPKQAIYRFRGASVETYVLARNAIERDPHGAVLHLTHNFRSRPAILEYVNRCFQDPLSRTDQPGYVRLTATLAHPEGTQPCVARLPIEVAPDAKALEVREAEAAAVADLCHRLLASYEYTDADGQRKRLRPSGIALLTPQSSSLHVYEAAFEAHGLPFASQAGKGLYRRQETQDMLALVRALADPSDTAAFGAVMRGPLVGLSDQELLDITAALRLASGESERRFTLRADPQEVPHPVASTVVDILQDLWRRSRTTTPALILAEAVERLLVMPILSSREGERWLQAAANVDFMLQRAKRYDIRGLKALAQDLDEEWTKEIETREGRIDGDDSISVVTIHSAKGLEWPVVIPINTVTQFRNRESYVYRPSDNTIHWVIGDVVSPELEDALMIDGHSASRERERLLYVGCTRARELLVVPDFGKKDANTWAGVVGLSVTDLPVISLPSSRSRFAASHEENVNIQTSDVFAAERDVINRSAIPLKWRRPTDKDADRQTLIEIATPEGEVVASQTPVGGGRLRGLVLHKLVEEVISGETSDAPDALQARAELLLAQLASQAEDATELPAAQEMAGTVVRTLHIPEVAQLRPTLLAELPIYAMTSTEGAEWEALAGRIDALSMRPGEVPIPIDWKSDIAPTEGTIYEHSRQLEDYLRALGATRGLLVYMTSGQAVWVSAPVA